jgi:hypothetical protein
MFSYTNSKNTTILFSTGLIIVQFSLNYQILFNSFDSSDNELIVL